MRVVSLALVTGLLASLLAIGASVSGCASGFERNGDDDGNDPRIDAPFGGNGDGGGGFVDARLVDAPGTVTDAPLQTDAPAGGGVECPMTQEYDDRAFIEILTNPNFVECTSGADCSSSQCCYGAIVCVAYP
ncbi:MAG TPA: hypothetical protein VM261_02035 [Kofleriaceae bacterium]|nr:hypothetical protein [Kofleriaceae bacterium]